MESLFAIVQQWVSSGSIWLAAGGSFVGGALTALNPCVIVMVPLLIGFIGGMDEEMTTWKSFLFTLVFILGFSVELAVLFTVGLAAAPFLQSEYMVYVVALSASCWGSILWTFSIFSSHFAGQAAQVHRILGGRLVRFHVWPRFSSLHRPGSATDSKRHSAERGLFGGVMMLFYGVGHCLLILAVGTSAGAARHLIGSTRMHAANLVLKKAAGALLACGGALHCRRGPVSQHWIRVLAVWLSELKMADDFTQIRVGEDKIGLMGLKGAIEEIAESHAERTDDEIQDAPSGEVIQRRITSQVRREKNMVRHSSGSLENSWANRTKKHWEHHCAL